MKMTETEEDKGRIPADDKEVVVEVSKGAVRRGERTVWEGLNVEVGAGEFMAILGPNGAGKSTFLKVVLGLLSLSAGTVRVFGQAARRGHPDIGYLPQRRHFDSDVHVRGRDIVRLGLEGARWGPPLFFLKKGEATGRSARIQQCIDMVGAIAYADRPIGELSGGEQQRLLIAQALVTHPKILMLDEPLESLDMANQQAVAGIIKHIAELTGAAVLMVAHDINPILSSIDRVIYMASGKVAVGTAEEVINTETLSRLYGSQVEVLRASDGSVIFVGHSRTEGEHIHVHH